VELPVEYKQIKLDCGYRIDLLVDDRIVVELKSVDQLLPIHEAQILTYLKLSGVSVGLLINFNVTVLKKVFVDSLFNPSVNSVSSVVIIPRDTRGT
jgi:GxxExxY protein